MRRSFVAVFALLVLALLPLSASADSAAQAQTFTVIIDVSSVSGPCPTGIFAESAIELAAASGVVNDAATSQGGTLAISATEGGRFPDQVVGEFVLIGVHSVTEIEFTGVQRCLDAQTFAITGLVWTGSMVDVATGQTYAINGAGRGNSFVTTVGPGGFAFTLTGTARRTTTPVFR